jgi:hypothetical protein
MIELDGITIGNPEQCSCRLFSCFSSKKIIINGKYYEDYIFYKLYLSKTHLYKRYFHDENCDDENYEVGKITRFIKTDHEYLLWIDNTSAYSNPSLKVKIYDTEIHVQYYTRGVWFQTFLTKDQYKKFLKSMNDVYTIYHSDDVVSAC